MLEFFSKELERRNAKKVELYKIQSGLAINIIDLASIYIYQPDNEKIKLELIKESSKVKLYFNDETLHILNELIERPDKMCYYDPLIDCMKKQIK